RQRLMARPACPAPTTTAVTVVIGRPSSYALATRRVALLHFDGHVRRIGHDIVNRRALLRLRNESLNIFAFRVGIDLVGDLDAIEAVANVAVDAEDALDVHVALDGGLYRAQLNVAMLGDRRDAGGQTAGKSDQDEFDRRGPFVLGGEHFGVVGIEGERGLAVLFLAQAVEAFDRRVAVRAVLPFAGRAPLELCSLRGFGQRLARRDQSFDVHAVFDSAASISHRCLRTLAASLDALTHSLRTRARPTSAG